MTAPQLHHAGNEEVLAILAERQRIVLTTHPNPDGDALGSEYAMYHMLTGMGKEVRIVNIDPMPENLRFLNGTVDYETWNPVEHEELLARADAIIALDFNHCDRMREMGDAACGSTAHRIVIDHHLEPQPFADTYLSVPNASSTAEIVYDLLEAGAMELTREIALGIYVGLMTDTGSFRFDRTTPRVHRIAARLLEHGVDPLDIHRKIFDDYPMNRTALLGRVLAGIEQHFDGRVTILSVTRQMFEDTGTTVEDVENVVNYGLGIRGVEVTALITELEDGHKISFRSRGKFSVNDIAGEFGGGGHRLAAGARLDDPDGETVREKVIGRFGRLFQQ
ncbi:MAG: bifunctional oligoribonuclease/PAP phosphatase NrnA [Ignavibacteria bacterium]|nr:MAG: bifunctional oligoribonuclease/PAP phosphatase NrnA [Ignavibacteria bacterium]